MTIAVKGSDSNSSMNKLIALGIGAFSIVEAIVTYFIVMYPLFIRPVFKNAYLTENNIPYIVKFFGKTFASEAEKTSGSIIVSLSGSVINIVLIYLVITAVPILLAYFFNKGFAFAKTYLIGIFGAKTVIGMLPLLVPFANIRNSMRIFGTVDAVLCLCICAYFVYLNYVEYADDMLFDEEQIKQMVYRAKLGGLLFIMTAAWIVFEKFAMDGYGISWSIYLGWADQQITQGYVLLLILAVALVAAIMYVNEADWALYFFAAFGAAGAISNIVALVNKIIWANTTYKSQKALARQGDEAAIDWVNANGMSMSWWRKTIFIGICFAVAAAIAVFAVMKIKSKLFTKPAADEKKPALAVWIGAGAMILCAAFTIGAVTVWSKLTYSEFVMGAMDYMYFIMFGGIVLFLALSLLGGYSFSKFGMLALYIIVGAANFSTIFSVFKVRNTLAKQTPGYVGYNYIIAGVLFILSLVCCLTLVLLFVYKEVNNYLYNKRNTQS